MGSYDMSSVGESTAVAGSWEGRDGKWLLAAQGFSVGLAAMAAPLREYEAVELCALNCMCVSILIK